MNKKLLFFIIVLILIGGYKIWHTDIFQRNVFPKQYWSKKVQSLIYTKELLEKTREGLLLRLTSLSAINDRDIIVHSTLSNRSVDSVIDDIANTATTLPTAIDKIDYMIEEINIKLDFARIEVAKAAKHQGAGTLTPVEHDPFAK